MGRDHRFLNPPSKHRQLWLLHPKCSTMVALQSYFPTDCRPFWTTFYSRNIAPIAVRNSSCKVLSDPIQGIKYCISVPSWVIYESFSYGLTYKFNNVKWRLRSGKKEARVRHLRQGTFILRQRITKSVFRGERLQLPGQQVEYGSVFRRTVPVRIRGEPHLLQNHPGFVSRIQFVQDGDGDHVEQVHQGQQLRVVHIRLDESRHVSAGVRVFVAIETPGEAPQRPVLTLKQLIIFFIIFNFFWIFVQIWKFEKKNFDFFKFFQNWKFSFFIFF